MADGSFATPVSKDRDDNAVGNPIWVNLSDGTDGIAIDGSGNLQVILAANDGVDIGDVTVNNGAGASAVNIQDGGNSITIDDGGGSITVDGTFSIQSDAVDDSAFTIATDYVNVSGFLADETTPDSVDEGDVGAARMTLDRKQLMVLADATTDSQRLAIDSSGNAQVDLAAVSVTAVPVSKDGSANSETNPIFVKITDTAVSGVEIHDYDTASAVAADSTSNHDYTVANTTFFLKSVIVAGSGNIKAEIQTGPVASLTTKAVVFLTGRQGDTQQVFFDPAIEVPVTSTGTVRIIRTNRQGSATDLYSTIIGNDV